MKSLRYAKLGAVLASAHSYHEQDRGFHDGRGDHRGNDHRGFDRHAERGHWEMRGHRWQWFDGFWFGR
jgi:hypothetical protein